MMTESRQPKMPGELFRLAISVMLFVSSYLYASTIAAAASNEDLAAQAYTEARESIRAQRYKDALRQLRTLQKNYPSFQNIAGVKTRIAVLHEADLAGSELSNFLSALDARDAGDPDTALIMLRQLIDTHTTSPLVDDAMYLMAYMQVMERFDYAAARIQIAELKTRLPETAYLDAAQYLNAIALEQSGQTASAVDAFQELRDKHTSVNLPFGFSVARGNVMSRYWFDRADRRLKMLADQQQQAAQLTHSRAVSDEELHLDVTIAGKPVTLILRQSALTSTAAWRTGLLNDSLPPSVSVLAGEVKGEADSWARVVLSERAIHGVASIGGKQYRLHPEDLIGTLDYYQPKHRAGVAVKLGGSAKELPMLLDSLPAPPLPDRGLGEQRSNRNGSRAVVNNPTDTRIVPLSIVIDSQYNRYYGGNALTHTLNALNVADAIYAPMGLALRIDESVVIQDTESDPMAIGPTKLETMLRNFRDYRQGKQTLFDDSALVYLFTGNAKTDITLGLAWIDTACRNDGFDVGVTTPTSFADVLLTHELGHSLGAHHDTDTTCSNMAGKLMSPRISARTESSFTSCSQDSINASKQRSCLYDAVDLAMTVRVEGDVAILDVYNHDSVRSVNAHIDVEVDRTTAVTWPSQCEQHVPNSAGCQLSGIAPQSTRSLSLPFQAYDVPHLSARVVSREVTDPSPANNMVALNVANPPAPSFSILAAANDPPSGEPTRSAATKAGALSWLTLLCIAMFCSAVRIRQRRSVRFKL